MGQIDRLSFADACAQYVHRFTCEHVPEWAKRPAPNGKYYAPQFLTDREWYDHTRFPGEPEWIGLEGDTGCFTTGLTWPLGRWLDSAYAPAACDMSRTCRSAVTHIDRDGYVYCTKHADTRRMDQPCRKLRAHELRRIAGGEAIARY